MKLLMPTSVPDGLVLEEDQSDVLVVPYDPDAAIPAEHRDAEAVVAWMNPRARVVEMAATLPNLRWVQCLGAGPESFLTAGFAPEVAITRGVDLHNLPVAEHTLALLLAAARRLDLARDAQNTSRWATEMSANQLVTRSGFTQIAGSEFVIWGLGRIGLSIASRLRALGGSVRGVGRSSGVRDGVEVVSVDDAASVLAQADALIAVLPDRANTTGIIGRSTFELLPTHSWFVNVGRGRTVDEGGLAEALQQGLIAGAALDVFADEPLPPSSPLWSLPNLIVTPHSAGGRPDGVSALVNRNLRRYRENRALVGLLE